MNGLFIVAFVAGCLALSAACLKLYEGGALAGMPPYSRASRLVLLMLVFLALYSIIEAIASRHTQSPGACLLVMVTGCFAYWRVFSPRWAKFLERDFWSRIPHYPPHPH